MSRYTFYVIVILSALLYACATLAGTDVLTLIKSAASLLQLGVNAL